MKEGMLQCSSLSGTLASTRSSTPPGYSPGSTESSRQKRQCFTLPSKSPSRMQPQRSSWEPEAFSNCIAFWNVLGILLLALPPGSQCNGSAWLCSVLQNAVEGDSRRDTESLKHLGFPVSLARNLLFSISFPVFSGIISKSFHSPSVILIHTSKIYRLAVKTTEQLQWISPFVLSLPFNLFLYWFLK